MPLNNTPFVLACITPHGGEMIPELSPSNPDLMALTRASMERIGEEMRRANPEVLVVLTPHGVRVDGQFSVANSERMQGTAEEAPGTSVGLEREVHRPLARMIVKSAQKRGVPVAELNFATQEGPLSCLPLDFGAVVPLWFMPETPIVVITPSRQLSMQDQLTFGEGLADAARESGLRIGLIASCDWAHAHAADGPYGYHPSAAKLDEQVVDLIRSNRIDALANFTSDFIEEAKPDGIWQALVLAGAMPKALREMELLSYEVPTYFGLICALVHPREA